MTSMVDIDIEIQNLEQQHALLAERIDAFDAQISLSERERVERKRLQKLKLATKDRIVSLRSRQS